MKIAVVTQSYYPRPGGVTEHVSHTVDLLRKRGHDVTIVTTSFHGETSEPGIVRIGRNILLPTNGAWVNVTMAPNLYQRCKRVLHELDPDVIHSHCPLAPMMPALTLKAAPKRARFVGTFHAAAKRMLGYQLFKPVANHYIDRIDARVAVSETARELIERYYPGHYSIIPNGVDCARFSPKVEPIASLRDGAFNILFVGRMDQRKGLKYLYHAMAMLSRRTSRRLRLLVVGDDGPRRHLLPRLPASVEVVYTGVVSKEALPRYFASGDVFCSPAIDRESFGIVLLEAMASGIPVVGTRIPGYLTLLRDRWNSLAVPPRNASALSDALLELASDDTLRWKLRNNALDFSRMYAWDRIVDQLETVYRGEELSPWESEITAGITDTRALRAQKA